MLRAAAAVPRPQHGRAVAATACHEGRCAAVRHRRGLTKTPPSSAGWAPPRPRGRRATSPGQTPAAVLLPPSSRPRRFGSFDAHMMLSIWLSACRRWVAAGQSASALRCCAARSANLSNIKANTCLPALARRYQMARVGAAPSLTTGAAHHSTRRASACKCARGRRGLAGTSS